VLLALHSDSMAFHGQMKKARDLTHRAVESAVHNDIRETAAVWQASGALREAAFGNTAEMRRQVAAALALSADRNVKLITCLAQALGGDPDKALAGLDEISRGRPSDLFLNFYWAPSIRAAAEVGRHAPERAVEILQNARYEQGVVAPFTASPLYPVYLHAQAHLMDKEASDAAAEFQKIVNHPGLVANFHTGALARLGLARAYAEAGDRANARKSYQDFLGLWKNADPDQPLLQQAKAEYARLQ
jgi:tetratricopeptide (TPR) repeat protein